MDSTNAVDEEDEDDEERISRTFHGETRRQLNDRGAGFWVVANDYCEDESGIPEYLIRGTLFLLA